MSKIRVTSRHAHVVCGHLVFHATCGFLEYHITDIVFHTFFGTDATSLVMHNVLRFFH